MIQMTMASKVKLLTLLLAVVWILSACRADQLPVDATMTPTPLVLTDEQDMYPLGRHLEILEDPTGELTIEDVASPELDGQFVPSQAKVPNFGFTDSAFWVRLRLRNGTSATDHWLLEAGQANMQFVDLYVPNPDGEGFVVRQTGALRAPSERDIPNTSMVLNLYDRVGSDQTVYARFQSGAAMSLSLALWEPGAFWSWAQIEKLLQGSFFGALLALLLLNLFLFVSLRERSYLYLVMLLASTTVFEAGYAGYTEIYIVPGLYAFKVYYQGISFSLMYASMLLFTDTFLELKTHHSRFHWVILATTGVWGVLLLLTPFVSYRIASNLMVPWALLSVVIVFAAGVASWMRGYPYARFFMFAWTGLLLAFIITILTRLAVISSTPFSEGIYRLGILWMAVCWSIALADRVNFLKAGIERSEHRLSQILEGLPLGVVVYGKDYRPSFANRRVVEILGNPSRGINPDISAGRTLAQAMEYFSFHVAGSDDRYPIEEMPVYRALQGEPDSADDIEADLIDRRIPIEIWASPVKDAKGDIDSAIVAFQDITLRRRAEAELAQHRTHLEELVHERTVQLTREVAQRELLAEMQTRLIVWLSVVNKVHQSLTGTQDLQRAHEQLLAPICQLLDAGCVFIGLWDGDSDRIDGLGLKQQDASSESVTKAQIVLEQDSSLRSELAQGRLRVLPADGTGVTVTTNGAFLQDGSVRTVILGPVKTAQTMTGFFCVGLPRSADTMTDTETTLLERVKFDLANLAEYARLSESYRALAAAEERNRLARDLHDSVTQALFSATVVSDVLPRIWRRDPEKAMQSLDDLRRLMRGALAEMRTMLLELRPASVIKTPLPELLAQLTEAAISRTELSFQMFVEQVPPLPEEVHISFYRIAQEALNNVVKHARASCVVVRLSMVPSRRQAASKAEQDVKLVIFDDGIGFSTEREQANRMGLGIMYERAAAIGAELTIESQPENGTQVTVVWPMELEKNYD